MRPFSSSIIINLVLTNFRVDKICSNDTNGKNLDLIELYANMILIVEVCKNIFLIIRLRIFFPKRGSIYVQNMAVSLLL